MYLKFSAQVNATTVLCYLQKTCKANLNDNRLKLSFKKGVNPAILKAIAEAVNNTHIKALDLSGHIMDKHCTEALMKALASNTQLQILTLANTKMQDDNAKIISEVLQSTPSFKADIIFDNNPGLSTDLQTALIGNRSPRILTAYLCLQKQPELPKDILLQIIKMLLPQTVEIKACFKNTSDLDISTQSASPH